MIETPYIYKNQDNTKIAKIFFTDDGKYIIKKYEYFHTLPEEECDDLGYAQLVSEAWISY
jgi:hypothetical protein